MFLDICGIMIITTNDVLLAVGVGDSLAAVHCRLTRTMAGHWRSVHFFTDKSKRKFWLKAEHNRNNRE